MTKKSELSLMGQMKKEAERDFHKFIKYVAELEKENKENKETLEHRDSVLSIMYDLVRCDYIKPSLKIKIIKAVIDDECGNFDDLTEKEKELWNYFWKGGFR